MTESQYEQIEWDVPKSSGEVVNEPWHVGTTEEPTSPPFEYERATNVPSVSSNLSTSPMYSASMAQYDAMPPPTEHAKPMVLRISDPQKHSDGTQGAYVSYLITTTTSVDTFSSTNPRPVRRRFQDFVWLYTALSLDYPACIIPPLPDKHRLEYIKGDRFSAEFIERRSLRLQWFLDRIARHPLLQKSQCTRIFLESMDFKNDKRTQSRHVQPSNTVLESLSDSLLNAFTKLKKPEDRFVQMKDNIDKLEDNLNTVLRLYSRIGKRQQDLQLDYAGFGQSVQGLSAMESNIHQPLHQFAETAKAYAKAMKTMSDQEEMMYLNHVHELLAYCRSAMAVLRQRDQKQMDFEELSTYLQQAVQDKERIKYPERGLDGSMHLTELLMDKLNQVRGVDLEQARREKLVRLEMKIKELQDEVARTNDISHDFSEQVMDEYTLFQQTKTNEIKATFSSYADCHIQFYEKGISIWENILPVLEAIDVNDTTGDTRTNVHEED
ncbi:lipid binding protein [Gongronella butleri]|nr:lipid binding protein [Gongronella butleri]